MLIISDNNIYMTRLIYAANIDVVLSDRSEEEELKGFDIFYFLVLASEKRREEKEPNIC